MVSSDWISPGEGVRSSTTVISFCTIAITSGRSFSSPVPAEVNNVFCMHFASPSSRSQRITSIIRIAIISYENICSQYGMILTDKFLHLTRVNCYSIPSLRNHRLLWDVHEHNLLYEEFADGSMQSSKSLKRALQIFGNTRVNTEATTVIAAAPTRQKAHVRCCERTAVRHRLLPDYLIEQF